MLIKATTLRNYKLDSLNGEIGTVREFYFDDQHWTVRYLVAETGSWLRDRQVLISPYTLLGVNRGKRNIGVELTKEQIKDSPSLESDKPVSRQFEEDYDGYYGLPKYWDGPYIWGSYPYVVRNREKWKDYTQGESSWNPHLRSTHDACGHHIQATDGEIGVVEDFIIDDETWTIRYMIVDTASWTAGKKVLISPQWIERVSWIESKVFVKLSREAVRESPEYTDELLLTRGYEIGLHKHYQRTGYWVDEPAEKEHA